MQHLRTLLSLVLTNSEVRKLLSDFSLMGRDLLSQGLQKAAGHIAPHEEALANVDATAPQDEFITEGGRRADKGETPVLEARIPGTGATVKQHPKEDEARVKGADGRERGVGEVKDTFGTETRNVVEGARGDVHGKTGVDPANKGDVRGTAAGAAGNTQARTYDVSGGTTGQAQNLSMGGGDAREIGRSAVSSGLGKADTDKVKNEARGILGDQNVDRAHAHAQDVRGTAQERGEREAREREHGTVGDEDADADVERKYCRV